MRKGDIKFNRQFFLYESLVILFIQVYDYTIFPPSTRISGFITGVRYLAVSNNMSNRMVMPQMMVTIKQLSVKGNK